jgi:membrane protease YdiL (CAAX protease family)
MEKEPFLAHSKYGTKILGLLLLIIGCGLIIGSLAALTGGIIWGDKTAETVQSAGYLRFIQAMSAVGFFALPALLFSYLVHDNPFSFSKIDKKITWQSSGSVLILAILLMPLTAFFAYLNEQIALPEAFASIQQWMEARELKVGELLKQLTNDSRVSILLLNIVVLGILPGVGEEWLFRGTIQPLLQEKIANKHVAIWVTAFIFSVIHLQFAGFIPRLLLGAYLGYLAVWSGSLWLPILAHVLHNTLSLVFTFFIIGQGIDTEHLDPFHIPGFIPVVIISALFVGYGLYRLNRSLRFF